MKNYPLVSIIMLAYNSELYIKRGIISALNQDYKNIELLIIDSSPNKKTKEVADEIKDLRIKYHYIPNLEIGAARNAGIRFSTGKYITFLDSDDKYLPEKVKKQVEYLQDNSKYKIAYCNALHYYQNKPGVFYKKEICCKSGNVLYDLLETSLVNPNTIMFEKEVMKKVGLINESKYFPEDWDLCLRMAVEGYEFGYLNEDLVIVEMRENSNTTFDIQSKLKENAIIMFNSLKEKVDKEYGSAFNNIIFKTKRSLALAYLINNNKIMFSKTIFEIYNKGIVIQVIVFMVCLIPKEILRNIVIFTWKMKRKKSFGQVVKNDQR
ncbi:MAG: hypothetical protein A2231_02405 [Candidatus Firestonebacteria bacterium RIFOXYA2_FULL_40_8]|nr:MAG: hypothetical protein A2231_02405 [Candidatus Firestonebacteria bacterium RIFOXYA2_FULL_40_8]